jgi:hypothetical protein
VVQIGSRVQDQLADTPIQELSNVDLIFRGGTLFRVYIQTALAAGRSAQHSKHLAIKRQFVNTPWATVRSVGVLVGPGVMQTAHGEPGCMAADASRPGRLPTHGCKSGPAGTLIFLGSTKAPLWSNTWIRRLPRSAT